MESSPVRKTDPDTSVSRDDWCTGGGKVIAWGGKKPPHIRCKVCGRRLLPKTRVGDVFRSPPELSYWVPEHKIRKTKRK